MLRRTIFDLMSRCAVDVFFRRIEVEGAGNVPGEGAVILASNHANALVDPLVIRRALRRPITLTAKASLAANPLLRFLLALLDAVRFERSAEAGNRAAAARANRRAIGKCRERLVRGEALCIFPEGKSHSGPGMLPFAAGAARMALDLPVPVRVVPVGLTYEDKGRFRSVALVRFGKPIDPARAAWKPAALTAEIRRRIGELTTQHARRREALLLERAARVVSEAGGPPPPLGAPERTLSGHVDRVRRLRAAYEAAHDAHPDEVTALAARVKAHGNELRRLGVDEAEVHLPLHAGRAAFFVLRELELVLVGGPLALFGLLGHLVPYLLVRAVAVRLSEERDQWASNAVYPGLVLFPLLFVVQVSVAWLLLPAAAALVITLLLPPAGAYYLLWRDRVGASWRRATTFLRWLFRRDLQRRLAAESLSIAADIERLAERSRPWTRTT